ncbi:MAG: hypothetical protein HGA44_09055 [Cellulomonadaceae bacterium]|nr:hypothetical protein [Cellulomonadaceae bacterium]
MPESADEMYARVVATLGVDGRAPTPPVATWSTFPWDGELSPRVLQPPQDEPVRDGLTADACWRCLHPDAGVLWRDGTWQVSAPEAPSGLPLVLFLSTQAHLDVADLDDDLAAGLGVATMRLARVMASLPHIGRVHWSQWGDGSAHLHVWFFARTARVRQTLGTFAAEWDEILPPVPADVWRADLRAVAAGLAQHGGRVIVPGAPVEAEADPGS